MALLKSIKNHTKTISFRLPAELVNDLDILRSDAKAQGLALDLTEQVERLVASSIKQARAELAEASPAPAADLVPGHTEDSQTPAAANNL